MAASPVFQPVRSNGDQCLHFLRGAVPDNGAQTEPVPIRKSCPHCELLVVNEAGIEIARGAEGELCVAGPSVMGGYWQLPENTANAFLPVYETYWYRTGDIVTELQTATTNSWDDVIA
jgi:acyl-CoA synthetase (AMP-forming)/AMP-acid ligase II